ncbi:MAG: flagellar biosynthesis regulator FlaF [Rhodospirillales bacterium]|nr:flagellar biosynthesis regulator FlaF [Rhodospirillales bacterium]
MSSQQSKIKSYERVPVAGQPAQTEGWALLEAAKRMASAIVSGDPSEKQTKENMKTALRLNWRLWTIFQAELLDEKCPVPEEIRINMLTLCQFVDKQTVKILINPSPEIMVPLIDINRNIAAGLMHLPEREAESEAPAAAPATDQPRISLDTEA